MSPILLAILSSFSAHADNQDSTLGRPPSPACRADFRPSDVLLLGDSISVTPYSSSMAKEITAGSTSFMVARYAVGGSNALHWATGFSAPFYRHKNTVCDSRAGLSFQKATGQEVPDFPALLASGKPKAIVVSLGTNDVNNYCATASKGGPSGPNDMWMRGVKKLAGMMPAGVSCIWVGPLNYKSGTIARNCAGLPGGVRGAISLMQSQIGSSCQFVDSSTACPLSLQFDNVGIHPVGNSAMELGSCIGKKVKELLGP